MEKEIWIPIKDYEDYYEISNYGSVRRIKYDNLGNKGQYKIPNYIKQKIDEDGYAKYTLCLNQKSKMFFAHRLVALHFLKNDNNYPVVNHKDGNKKNNYFENLEWCTIKYNNNHALINGLRIMPNGKNSKLSKIVEQYDLDGNLIEIYESSGDAGRKNNISSGHIRDCCRNNLKTYKGYIWKYKVN